MASRNSRLLRPITTHRRTQGVLVGCPTRKARVQTTVDKDGNETTVVIPGRRPQVVVERPKGEGMTLVRVMR